MAGPSHEHGEPPRIRFREPGSARGFIDAAWWPHTRDLTAEVPPLLNLLWTAGRDINRITYHLPAWDPAPRRLRIGGRTVRLGGFAVGDANTVTLSDPWGHERIDILVITPDDDPAHAEQVMELVGTSDGAGRAGQILELATRVSHVRRSP